MYGYTEEKEKKREIQEENLTGVPDGLLHRAEEKAGMSLRDVRVHYNSPEPASIQALAYAQGSRIYIGPGQECHLPHELGHVVQQKKGLVKATGTVKGLPVNDETELEKDADAFL